MTVDELKDLLKVEKDPELAKLLDRVNSSVSNWRTNGIVPDKVVQKAKEIANSLQGFNGSNNQINLGATTSPDLAVLSDIMRNWDAQRRKKLLRFALELDEQ